MVAGNIKEIEELKRLIRTENLPEELIAVYTDCIKALETGKVPSKDETLEDFFMRVGASWLTDEDISADEP